MKVLCIDDDPIFLGHLRESLNNYLFEKNIDVDIISYTEIPSSVPKAVDIFFLDIEIDKEMIFQYITLIRKDNLVTPIVILSNYDRYIHHSVKYHIFDFIRKKDFDNEFRLTMDRIMPILPKGFSYILIKSEGCLKKIRLLDIIYIESFSHSCAIHTRNDIYDVHKGIKEVLGENYNYFLQVHRSYYINKEHIQTILPDKVLLKEDLSLPVGRKYRQSARNEYFLYLCQKKEDDK